MVWHVWMVGRLQLTAAAEVAGVTRGMWSWLLRCLAHLAAAMGLLLALLAAAFGGTLIAAGAWVLASVVRQLRSAAKLEVRARRIWAPLAVRVVDSASALAAPLLHFRLGAGGGVIEPEVATTGNKPCKEVEEGKEGKLPQPQPQHQTGGKHVARKGLMATLAAAVTPLWESINSYQVYTRDSLTSAKHFVQGLVPKWVGIGSFLVWLGNDVHEAPVECLGDFAGMSH